MFTKQTDGNELKVAYLHLKLSTWQQRFTFVQFLFYGKYSWKYGILIRFANSQKLYVQFNTPCEMITHKEQKSENSKHLHCTKGSAE